MNGGNAMLMPSRFAGRCHVCSERYEAGEMVLLNPPKGKRKRWLARHATCRPHHTFGTEGAWRGNAAWMTAEQFRMLEDAMSRQVPAQV